MIKSSTPTVIESQARIRLRYPEPFLCFSFYVFIFLIPFETLDIGIKVQNFTASKLIGFIFMGLALIQPKVCFKPPHPACVWFLAYLVIYLLFGVFQDEKFELRIITYAITIFQLLALFWISQNLMAYEGVAKRAMLTLGISCLCLAVLVLLGVLKSEVGQSRITASGFNANAYAALLSLGMLALAGLATNHRISNYKIRAIAWLSFSFLAVAIVQSGSRSSMIAFLLGLGVLLLKGRGLKINPRSVLLVLLAFGVIVGIAYQSEVVRQRWEKTIVEGNTSGRDRIYSRVADMIMEKPLLGWGPVTHYFELGSRVGKPMRDPHSIYFWVLLEVGLLGALPFFVGLWLCWLVAWRSRFGGYGRLPMAMIFYLSLVSLNHSYHHGKIFWLILAYAVASGNLVQPQKWVERTSVFPTVEST